MDDPYLWLEELDSPEALRWVAARNAETMAALDDPEFARVRDAIREVLDSKDRIPYPRWRGDGFYYDFWRDADHPRGVWRRTTVDEYRRDEPEWDVLLDVDALNEAEDANWVWGGAVVLRPGFDRCLVRLSRGGADAVVVREFDLGGRVFVADGFTLPEAKSDVGWIDADTVYVGTDFGPGSLTSSGYPRVVRRWRRGTPLAEAETVYEGEVDDVSVNAGHDPTPGYERDFVGRYLDFYRSEQYLRRPGGDLVRIDVPDDANCDVHRDWLLIRLRSPWLGHPVGALLAAPFDVDGLAVRQYFAISADGTRVPYFVVGPETPGPALLTGYGGFEVSLTPGYSGTIGRGWLARGGTYAVANIRGGGEYGPAWHRAAQREGRVKSFEDFAAVAADLVARGITTPERLGIEGGSNGGLLMGAMLTRYPELLGAVVAAVPLLDMLRYTKLLAGASWIAEYGDPDDEADAAFLRELSPYHNVRAGRPYPPVLLITSTRDDRVHPGHARKMVALLREHGYDVTYYENVEGGHGTAADNEQAAMIWGLTLEFLWRRLA